MFKLNPINRKRWCRFKRVKRAYWSLRLLLIFYGISLIAELLCNGNPLLVKHEGSFYFPFLTAYNDVFFRNLHLGIYPEDQFLGNGQQSPPNYKELQATPEFAGNDANYMVFAPIPYGKSEVINLANLDISDDLTLRFVPITQAATVDVRADLTISRSMNLAPLLKVEDDFTLRDKSLQEYMLIPPALTDALGKRFANEPAPELELESRALDGRVFLARIREWEPRGSAPRTLRINLREQETSGIGMQEMIFAGDQSIRREAPVWETLAEEQRAEVRRLIEQRIKTTIEPHAMVIDGQSYLLRVDKADRRYPFRPLVANRHFMGIDASGRDVMVRILYALRISLNFGVLLVLVTYAAGIAIGAIQGYFAGKIDIFSQRLIEIWSTMPFLYVIILLGAVLGRSFLLLLVVYALFNWIAISYYMRAEFLRLRKSAFVESAKCLGVPNWKIIVRHILPNATTPIITFFPFALVGAIGSLNALDYLGYGLPPPTPSWGELLAQAQHEPAAWWLIVFPFIALFSVILLGVFIGEGVRSAFDPKSLSRQE